MSHELIGKKVVISGGNGQPRKWEGELLFFGKRLIVVDGEEQEFTAVHGTYKMEEVKDD